MTKMRAEELADAASFGSIEVVHEFLQSPQIATFLNCPTGEAALTALMAATQAGRLDVVQELIKADAQVNLTDTLGRTALMHAAVNGEVSLFGPLIDAGADASIKADNGWTCLHFACAAQCSYGHCEAVEQLIDLSERRGKVRDDMELQSALNVARSKDRLGVVQLLDNILEDETGCFTPRGS